MYLQRRSFGHIVAHLIYPRGYRVPNLRIVPPPPSPPQMSLGDLLYRLSIVSPDDYRAVERIARSIYAKRWPHPNRDILDLLPTGTH